MDTPANVRSFMLSSHFVFFELEIVITTRGEWKRARLAGLLAMMCEE
jgi:hypothetical protein